MLFANASGHTILCQNSQNRWVITAGLISITFTSYHYHKGQCSEVLGPWANLSSLPVKVECCDNHPDFFH